MSIIEYPFDEELISSGFQLFPKEITGNGNILYHGTSSYFEKQIEKDGLKWSDKVYTKKDIQEICTIFQSIYKDIYQKISLIGSYHILQPYSLEDDFKDNDVKPIYFAETSYRAMMYAMPNYAGGETIKGIRNSFQDLMKYVSHIDGKKEYQDIVRVFLDFKQPLFNNVKAVHDNHQYGIVYAVLFEDSDEPILKSAGPGGFYSYEVSVEKIVGKVKVPKNYIYQSLFSEIGYSKNTYWRNKLS